MSTKLHPWQVTGNISKTYHEMLFLKNNAKIDKNSVFGEGYFNLKAPAKTFRTRNHSMMADTSNKKKEPMLVKKNLKLTNGFNYSIRKFHLQSDKQVDRLMPTDLSVANLMHYKQKKQHLNSNVSNLGLVLGQNTSSIQQLLESPSMAKSNFNSDVKQKDKSLKAAAGTNATSTFGKRSYSVPPPIRNPDEETLPELNATKAKIEQHISKSPMRNVSILIGRSNNQFNSRMDLETNKTPSYMREEDQSRLTNNADIQGLASQEKSSTKLPPLSSLKGGNTTQPDSVNVLSDNSKLALQQRVFAFEARHKSPKELLQEKLIENASQRTSNLRAGIDHRQIRHLSEMTGAIHAKDIDERLRVIYSPKEVGISNALTSDINQAIGIGLRPISYQDKDDPGAERALMQATLMQNYPPAHLNDSNSAFRFLLQTKSSHPHKSKDPDDSPAIPRDKKSLTHANKLSQPALPESPTRDTQLSKHQSQNKKSAKRRSEKVKRQPSKHHETVGYVPSPQFSKQGASPKNADSRLMSTQHGDNKFMDTQRIPFRRTSKLSNNNYPSQDQQIDHSNIMVKGSSGQLSLDGATPKEIAKNERDAFKDFTRTTSSNMQIKLDPEEVEREKTRIKIKDVNNAKGGSRSKLKIAQSKSPDSDGSIISKDSNLKEDDDDYYEELQLHSKLLKPKRGARHQQQLFLDDKVETEGKRSHLGNTLSSLNKTQTRLSPKQTFDSTLIQLPKMKLKHAIQTPSNRRGGNSPSGPHKLQNSLQSALVKESSSKGAITIMNVTFNQELAVKESQSRGNDMKQKLYGTGAFRAYSKRRFEKRGSPERDDSYNGKISGIRMDSGSPQSSLKGLKTSAQIKISSPRNTGTSLRLSKANVMDDTSASKITPLSNPLQITGNLGVRKQLSKSPPNSSHKLQEINITMQPHHQARTHILEDVERKTETRLEIQGKEAHLEPRPQSVHSKAPFEQQVSVKVLIDGSVAKKKQKDSDELGRTQQRGELELGIDLNDLDDFEADKREEDARRSSMTATQVAEILRGDDQQSEEEQSPLKIHQPKLAAVQSGRGSQRKLQQLNTSTPSKSNSGKRNLKKVPSSNIGKKQRKTILEKTNGGVEPWNNAQTKDLRHQSVLSFANLQNDSDEDIGPVIKDNDSVEFLLNKDESVQKLPNTGSVMIRSSTNSKNQIASSAIVLNSKDKDQPGSSKKASSKKPLSSTKK